MRTIRVVAVAVAPLLLMADQKSTCPMGPFGLISPREQQSALYHQISVNAERLAPSTEKHRAADSPGLPTTPGFPPAANFVDTEIFAKMQQDHVTPTVLAGDEEFLRRVSLDLTGQIPDATAVQSFVADNTPGKRAKMIDQLLASDAFVDRWTMWFGDLVQNVQVSANTREFPHGRNVYYQYIHDSIAANKPYDQMVREVLAGSGDSTVNGQANYVVRQLQPNGPAQDTYDNLSAASGQEFLGMPFLCLSCHNGIGHLDLVNTYLKNKARADFWGNAAFFARARAQQQADATTTNGRKYVVSDATNGQYQLNTTSGNKTPRQPINGQATVAPALLLTTEGPGTTEPWRNAYGRILTANPQFAIASVNYVWKEMFGLAMVEPTNNIDPNRLSASTLPPGQTLQPTHPQLLSDLATNFKQSGYDLRGLLRLIANSSTYQLSTQYTPGAWNETWTPYFARHYPHRLMAEEMLDAITKSTNVPATLAISGGLPTVTSAMKLPDPTENRNNSYGRFLDEFGRGNRDDEARTNDTSIAQALSLMNDSTVVVSRVHRATANSTVARALAASTDPGTIADTLYLATLSRRPTTAERAQAIAYLKSGTLAQKTEDLQWVLLNSLEFLFD